MADSESSAARGTRAFSNKEFKKKEYWDQRFETEEEFDWFHPYKAFRHHIRERVRTLWRFS
jgi:hypothetical protein